ncbi:potassium-transporting ATPase subunit F [Xylanimonas protaetiae]|uniref:Potassium-transporting ATPase subunit F n=1 Tax=Xylanimonas protaetiae TaxID=2509457 RepID=A0A4P6F160_9MICO|nr:potassium-transporting ATPase subunit F [Xylanimonas protaetiae]QAY68835.1 potassium-transporting ATPase subunit F [Xylanimonas protaetiae]
MTVLGVLAVVAGVAAVVYAFVWLCRPEKF